MIQNLVSSRSIEENIKFFLAMKRYLAEGKKNKYETLVYSHIWITCVYFSFCTDAKSLIANVLHIGNDKVIDAIDILIKKDLISDKPYMIKLQGEKIW